MAESGGLPSEVSSLLAVYEKDPLSAQKLFSLLRALTAYQRDVNTSRDMKARILAELDVLRSSPLVSRVDGEIIPDTPKNSSSFYYSPNRVAPNKFACPSTESIQKATFHYLDDAGNAITVPGKRGVGISEVVTREKGPKEVEKSAVELKIDKDRECVGQGEREEVVEEFSAAIELSSTPMCTPPPVREEPPRRRRRSGGKRMSGSAAGGRDWTSEFRSTLEMPFNSPQERLRRSARIRGIASDFVEAATAHGKTIISEAFLPPHVPRTLSCLKDAGGIAGGQKYLVDGIFFKFALDYLGLYGGDENAAKAAGHELLGVAAYYNCQIPKLCLPLVALIDYCGYRLMATSQLPISSETLVYGSSDGGHTIHSEDEEACECMRQAARILNIKGHYVGSGSARRFLYGPCDVEVHRASDGRLYVLDTARLFPPEPPIRSRPGCHLYNLLRPELVKSNSAALSSDAYTCFGRENREENDREVRGTQQRLFKEVIPNLVLELTHRIRRLTSTSTSSKKTTGVPLQEQQASRDEPHEAQKSGHLDLCDLAAKLQLVELMHREGVNCRYLILLKKTEIPLDHSLCIIVNTEIAARRVKNRLRAYMRDQLRKLQMLSPRKKLPEKAVETEGIDMPLLLVRLLDMVGLKLRDGLPDRLARGLLPSEDDIIELSAKVKYTNTVPYQEGVAFYQQARMHQENALNQSLAEADELLQVAGAKFREALQTKPDDYHILTHYGILHVERAKMQDDCNTRDALFEDAMDMFEAAVRIRRSDHYALFHWGDALQEWASRLDDANCAERKATLLASAREKFQEAHVFGKKWFFGTLPTSGVRGLLRSKSRGAFFIRNSNSRPGHFVLTFLDKNPGRQRRIRHVLIEETVDGGYTLRRDTSKTLEEIVVDKIKEGYHPITKDWDFPGS